MSDAPLPGAWASLWHLLTLLRAHYPMMALCTLVGLLNQVATIGSGITGAYLVGVAATDRGGVALGPMLALLAALVVARALLAWLDMWLVHDVAYRVLAEIRIHLYSALERLAPAYLTQRRSGDLAAAAMGDVEALEWFYAHTIVATLVAILVPTGALALLAWMAPTLPLVLLPWMLLVATVPLWLGRWARTQGQAVREQLAIVNAEVVDSIQGLREIVTFGQGERHLERLRRTDGTLLRHQIAYGSRVGFESATMTALTALGMTSVLALSASLVARGALDPSLFPVAVLLAAYSFTPLVALTGVLTGMGRILAAASRVLALLHQPAPVTDRVTEAPTAPLRPHVRFERVGFRYAPALPDALREVSFEIRPGETVALVGHSGAGKSTCASLLLRFWDVTEGAITLGGYDLRDLPQATLRAQVALVAQDTYLFNSSLRDNIRLGRPTASDAEVEAAARAAQAHDFIAALPQGYDTQTGERGVQLSGGQRQRIAIARALLKDAPLLILDEAVANLDSESERAVNAALARLRAGRTTLVIAHRLSTIRNADKVVVLEGGRVAEIGTPAELLQRNGPYSHLMASQVVAHVPAPTSSLLPLSPNSP